MLKHTSSSQKTRPLLTPPNKETEISTFSSELLSMHKDYIGYVFPKVSVVIATYNCSQSIGLTLESVLSQEYPDLEVIVIDANSRDRTLEVIKSFFDDRIRIYSVSDFKRYEILNKGISLANGLYINFLFPGDFYTHRQAIQNMMGFALDHQKPDLVYGGCLIRDGRSEVKMLYRPLNLELLKHGQQPTTLQACWFRTELFQVIGKFSTLYQMRGGFDLFCRFCTHPGLTVASTTRVLTDYDLRGVTKRMVVRHFWDTLRILHAHFGWTTTLKWLVTQKDSKRFFKLWMRSLKIAFVGKT